MAIELDGYDLRVVCESLDIASKAKKEEVKQIEQQIKVERDFEEIEALMYGVKELHDDINAIKRIRSYLSEHL